SPKPRTTTPSAASYSPPWGTSLSLAKPSAWDQPRDGVGVGGVRSPSSRPSPPASPASASRPTPSMSPRSPHPTKPTPPSPHEAPDAMGEALKVQGRPFPSTSPSLGHLPCRSAFRYTAPR